MSYIRFLSSQLLKYQYDVFLYIHLVRFMAAKATHYNTHQLNDGSFCVYYPVIRVIMRSSL